MNKGGYILLDCNGLDLTTEAQSNPGIYQKVEAAYKSGKPVYAVNCLWDGVSMSPISVMLTYDETLERYMGTASTLQVVVSPDNFVEIINMLAS